MGIEEFKIYENYSDSISIIDFMLFDLNNSNTLINMVTRARENARSVQEHISRELWLSVNKYYLYVNNKKIIKKYKKSDPIDFVNELLQYNHIYYSSADITQERGNAYCFMNLGKYFERVVQSIDFLSVRVISLNDENKIYLRVFWKTYYHQSEVTNYTSKLINLFLMLKILLK